MATGLPDAKAALQLLAREGVQFAVEKPLHQLPGGLEADIRVLRASGCLHVGDTPLATALKLQDLPVYTLQLAASTLRGYLTSSSAWVLGFSGFATEGYPYKTEASWMEKLFKCLGEENLPSLVTDGGCREGVLGLSGVLAKRYGVPSMGFYPRTELTSMAPRNNMVLWGSSFRQREELVGLAADALWCVGGKACTVRECKIALAAGSPVALMAMSHHPRDTLSATFRNDKTLWDAMGDGQLLVCYSEDEIADTVKAMFDMLRATTRRDSPARAKRLRRISTLLSTQQ